MTHESAYGLWSLVIINSLIFIMFAFSFFKPRSKRDWRSFSAFSAFIVALFIEMYGFPLTIYLLSGWLLRRYPSLDLFSHDAGHLWNTLLGWEINPHFDPLHILSNILIFGGFILLAGAWKVLYEAQRTHTLATTGPYAYVRHPQYVGFILIMLGFLFQWPTLITLIMFPILVTMYVQLARREEREVLEEFGNPYRRYMVQTPAFFPRIRNQRPREACYYGQIIAHGELRMQNGWDERATLTNGRLFSRCVIMLPFSILRNPGSQICSRAKRLAESG